jgi:hypothetical protein
LNVIEIYPEGAAPAGTSRAATATMALVGEITGPIREIATPVSTAANLDCIKKPSKTHNTGQLENNPTGWPCIHVSIYGNMGAILWHL